ncbi:hypothetical protein HN51_034341 [Arachis hypogaea]
MLRDDWMHLQRTQNYVEQHRKFKGYNHWKDNALGLQEPENGLCVKSLRIKQRAYLPAWLVMVLSWRITIRIGRASTEFAAVVAGILAEGFQGAGEDVQGRGGS